MKKKNITIISIILLVGLLGCQSKQQISSTEQINQENGEVLPLEEKEGEYIYIADPYKNKIDVYDQEGNLTFTALKYGREEGRIRFPIEIARKGDRLYILDMGNNRIQVFDRNFTFLFSFGNQVLKSPAGFDIYKDDVYVANTYRSRIEVFSLDGGHKLSFGSVGRGPGQFAYLNDVAVDEDYIYALDTSAVSIEIFTHDGKFIEKWGKYSKNEDGFRYPLGIEVYNKTVFVSDAKNNRLGLYTKDGALIKSIGGYGNDKDQFNYPGVIWESNGMIYINDGRNGRTKIYYPNGELYKILYF